MSQTFSMRFKEEGIVCTWSVEILHKKFSHKPSTSWEIPSDFEEGWSWGDDHISEHLERCLDADLSYPILVWDGLVVDGCHRICKALSQGESHIQAILIENMIPPCSDEEAPFSEPEPPRWNFGDMVKVLKVLSTR